MSHEILYEEFVAPQKLKDNGQATNETSTKKNLTASEEIRQFCAGFTKEIPPENCDSEIQEKPVNRKSNIFGAGRPLYFPGVVKNKNNEQH